MLFQLVLSAYNRYNEKTNLKVTLKSCNENDLYRNAHLECQEPYRKQHGKLNPVCFKSLTRTRLYILYLQFLFITFLFQQMMQHQQEYAKQHNCVPQAGGLEAKSCSLISNSPNLRELSASVTEESRTWHSVMQTQTAPTHSISTQIITIILQHLLRCFHKA